MIHKVNLKFNEFLDEGNYSIPRLANGYKGEILPVFKVPQPKDPGDRERAKLAYTRSMDLPIRSASTPGPATANNSEQVKSGGIASIWAATGRYEANVPEIAPENTTAKHTKEDTISPLPSDLANEANHSNNTNANGENHTNGHAVRRGSDGANNDMDSVMSDITVGSTAPVHGRAPARRSSLAMMVGLGGSASKCIFYFYFC